MAYSPTTPPRPDGGECVPCYPVEDGHFFEAMQTPHPGLFGTCQVKIMSTLH